MVAFDRSTMTEEVQAMRTRDQVWRKLLELYNLEDEDNTNIIEGDPLEGLSAKSNRADLNKAMIEREEELHNARQDAEENLEEDDLENDAFDGWTVDEHLRAQTSMLREMKKSRPCEFYNFGTTRKDCGVCKQDPSLQPFHDSVPRVSMKCIVHEVYVCSNMACLNAHLQTQCGYTCNNDANERLESTEENPTQGETTQKANKGHGKGAEAQKRRKE